MADGDSLGARQKRFVAAMLTAPTVEDAARAAKISERTGYRYLNDPGVKAALACALDGALQQATARAVTAMGAALDTLEQIHTDPTASHGARVSAARTILTSAPSLREAMDLAQRVDELERRLSGNGE